MVWMCEQELSCTRGQGETTSRRSTGNFGLTEDRGVKGNLGLIHHGLE